MKKQYNNRTIKLNNFISIFFLKQKNVQQGNNTQFVSFLALMVHTQQKNINFKKKKSSFFWLSHPGKNRGLGEKQRKKNL